jgi:hypothetical protein
VGNACRKRPLGGGSIGSKILEIWSLNLAGLGLVKDCENGDEIVDSIKV